MKKHCFLKTTSLGMLVSTIIFGANNSIPRIKELDNSSSTYQLLAAPGCNPNGPIIRARCVRQGALCWHLRSCPGCKSGNTRSRIAGHCNNVFDCVGASNPPACR